MHGGPTKTEGPASPTWLHGRYSKIWGKQGLSEEYEALSRADLTDATLGLRNLAMRQFQLLDAGVPSAQTLKRIGGAADAFERALRRKADKDTQNALLSELLIAVKQGTTESERWDEVEKLEAQLDKKRAHIERSAINAQLLVNVDFVRGLAIRLIYANQNEIRRKFQQLALPSHEAEDLIQRIGHEFARECGPVFHRVLEPASGAEATEEEA